MRLEDVQNKINDKYPEEDLVVLNYENMSKPCTIKCNKCGEEYTLKTAQSFFKKDKKRICKKCVPNKIEQIKETREKFKKFIENSRDFVLNQSLDNVHSKDYVSCICAHCRKENKKSMIDYMRGRKCQCQIKCPNIKKTTEEFKAELDGEYILLSEYKGAYEKVLLKHSCGFVYEVTPHNYLTGKRCPKCMKKESKGELAIKHYLEKNNIKFIQEYPVKIEDHLLRFDFYLPELNIYIEFQGIQHFEPVEYFGGEERLTKQQEYDNLKRKYAKDKLISISYEDFDNIENILSKTF